jgi:glutathione S-transferase
LQVDKWIEYAPTFAVGREFEKATAYVNDHCALRTFLVGSDVSVADVVVWAALAGDFYFPPVFIRQSVFFSFLSYFADYAQA